MKLTEKKHQLTRRLLFIGAQGSGKSTQAEIFAQKHSLPHVESGSLVREYEKGNTQEAKELKLLTDAGNLAPDELVAKLVKERLEQSDCAQGYVLDGYPRDSHQEELYMPPVDLVFDLAIPRSEAVKRLTSRGRLDDTPEAIQVRLDAFERLTKPVLADFKAKGILHIVDATPPIAEVSQKIEEIINGR